MTFDEFFSANYKDPPGLDRNTAAQVRRLARMSLIECWNAAVDATFEAATHCDSHESLQKLPARLKVQ